MTALHTPPVDQTVDRSADIETARLLLERLGVSAADLLPADPSTPTPPDQEEGTQTREAAKQDQPRHATTPDEQERAAPRGQWAASTRGHSSHPPGTHNHPEGGPTTEGCVHVRLNTEAEA